MDPIIIYKELFQIELQRNSSFDINNILSLKHDHAKEKLLTHLNAMDIEPTNLHLPDDSGDDELFNDDDDDDISFEPTPEFVLTYITTDEEIEVTG